jgi:hypothetical protein
MFIVALSSVAAAQEPPRVTNVIVFDVGADMAKFTELSKRARAIREKYQSTGKVRLWMSAFAGPNTNRVVVTVEYPSLVAMAQSWSKVTASPEWQKLIADARVTNIKRLSDSVLIEMQQ